MNVHDLIYSINTLNLRDLLPVVSVCNEEDAKRYNNRGYATVPVEKFNRIESLKPYLKYLHYQKDGGFNELLYYHPEKLSLFSIGLFCDGNEVMLLHDEPGELIPKFENSMNEAIKSGNVSKFVIMLPQSYRLEFICHNLAYIPEEYQYQAFFEAYSSVDYGFDKVREDVFKKIISRKNKEEKERTRDSLKEFPDTIHIYRGIGDRSFGKGYSYTTDSNVARFFAFRHSVNAKYVKIVEADINKDDIIEYIDDRNENEIVAFPNVLKNEDRTYYDGIHKILDMYPEVINEYQKQKKYLDKFLKSNPMMLKEHDEQHLFRVLLLCIILAEHYKVPKKKRVVLYNAAMFHDIGRVNEAEDSLHGELSYKKLCEYDKKYENVLLEKLIVNHCKDDDLTLFNENEQIIYKILKDADALDRQRFGVRELDESYLRLDFSKELMFAAFQATCCKV